VAVSSSLTIEEVDDPGSGRSRRSLVLTGPGLPFWGASWESSTKLVTKWPAGSREATQQVIGPREMPSTWQGQWRRNLLGRSPARFTDETGARLSLADPMAIWDALEGMALGGLRLRVTFSLVDQGSDEILTTGPQGVVTRSTRAADPNRQIKIVREGRAGRQRVSLQRLDIVDWEVTFEWVGRGAGQQKTAPVRDDSLTAAVNDAQAAVQQLLAMQQATAFLQSNPHVPRSAGTLTLGQLERLANAPILVTKRFTQQVQRNLDDLARVVGVARTVAVLPLSVAGQAVTSAANTVDLCKATADTLTQTPPELLALRGSVADLVRGAKFSADTRALAARIARDTLVAEQAMRVRAAVVGLQGKPGAREVKMAPSDVLAVHVARPGDTPQRISLRYYGTPDRGADILRANNLPLYQVQLPVGRPIVIPAASTSQSQP
jgi:hypothetical protein